MASKSAPSPRRQGAQSGAEQAYGAAADFVQHLSTLAWHARTSIDASVIEPRPTDPKDWQPCAGTFAMAFIAWHDLSGLLTPDIRNAARRVYPPGAASIRFGGLRAKPTVIELVAEELGVYFRNVLYQDRQSPLDPDLAQILSQAPGANAAKRSVWIRGAIKRERAAVRDRLGIKSWGGAFALMCREWNNQAPDLVRSRLERLRCGSIDFDDLRVQLDREAVAVLKPAHDGINPPASAGTPQILYGEGRWLMVRECAELLLKDVSGIDLEKAKARVSWAASAGKFRTNGKKRTARRIEPVSFSAWRLAQRERDLDAADE